MRWPDVAVIVSWFVLSRVMASAAGIAPEPTLPEMFWQLLPFELLRDRPGESLWYLHSQPPLYNMLVAVLLQLPGDVQAWWRALWLVMGVIFPLVFCSAMLVAGAPRWLAHLFALVVALNPTLLLYENLLLYTYPEALCVLLGFYALLRTGLDPPRWLLFSISTTVLVLFRAMFQPLWSVGIAVTTATALGSAENAENAEQGKRRTSWRVTGMAALVLPIIMGGMLILKNGLLFDVWTSSSWFGHNMAKLTAMAMLGETPRLHRLGVVSPVFVVGPFAPLHLYPPALVTGAAGRADRDYGGAPALTVVAKPNGSPNFNHLAYIDLSRQLMSDSIAAYQARPWLVRETILRGVQQFHQAASLYTFLDANRRRLKPIEDLYFNALYPRGTVFIVEAAVILTIVSSGAVWLFGMGRFFPLRAAAGYVLATTVWVITTGNFAEYGENSRFRFTLDPMMITWLGVAAVVGVLGMRSRQS